MLEELHGDGRRGVRDVVDADLDEVADGILQDKVDAACEDGILNDNTGDPALAMGCPGSELPSPNRQCIIRQLAEVDGFGVKIECPHTAVPSAIPLLLCHLLVPAPILQDACVMLL